MERACDVLERRGGSLSEIANAVQDQGCEAEPDEARHYRVLQFLVGRSRSARSPVPPRPLPRGSLPLARDLLGGHNSCADSTLGSPMSVDSVQEGAQQR